MSKKPKVSIILPTHNGSKYIHESIKSCLAQTYTDFELIIIDDCSRDETPDIIKSFKDERIIYSRNEQNQRLPKSLNIGFSISKGDFLTWTSDDNIYMPFAIEKMLNSLKESKCEFVYSDIYTFKDSNLMDLELVRLEPYNRLKAYNCIRACFLYARNVFDKIGEYDPDTELIEDYDYWVRVSKHFPMHHIQEPLYYYRFHPNSLWCSRLNEIKVIELLFKLKHGFQNKQEVNWHLRDLLFKKSLHINLLNKLLINFKYKNQIQSLLNQYENKDLNFTETRRKLNKIINNSE
jgi:glycosyltransferase involved in cell wall biosynthesis